MSNSLAIAATTATLRQLLSTTLNADLPGTSITTKPLDKARNGTGNQVNLFLYQTTINTAYSNLDMPGRVKSGETGVPSLALNLHYLITAYGENDDDTNPVSHQLLGRAMSVLHDHPLLGREEIKNALMGNDLHEQVERIRITPQSLSLDELSKLWNTFQTGYRLSVAYQVTVILIESTRPAKTPLPVLKRGAEDDGIAAQPDLIPPFPTLTSIQAPNQQTSVRLGETLTLQGYHLDGDTVKVRLTNKYLTAPAKRSTLSGGTASEVRILIPNTPAQAVAGIYGVAVVIERTGELERMSNELPFTLAPRIETIAPNPAPRDANNQVTLTITCSPQVQPGQRVALLVGDREILAEFHPIPTDTLKFIIQAAVPGDYFIRLRIDGVDSLLIDRTVIPPVFDPSQKVTIL
ncbi:MAG: DUF4255 domain-containing protein [Thioploca sp.]|nr:DUF4255 domain-containing protein [Thioploca sp.]